LGVPSSSIIRASSMRWSAAVSYTHLDVYKRQRQAWAAARPSLAADEATRELAPAVRSTWVPPLLHQVMPVETLPGPRSSSPANREPDLDYQTPPAVALSPCRPAARQRAVSAAAAAEQVSAKAMAPAAGCKEKVQAQAEKAQGAAPIPTHTEGSRRIPAPAAREPAPAARPPYPCLLYTSSMRARWPRRIPRMS